MATLILTVAGQSLGASIFGSTLGGAVGGAIGGLLGAALFGEDQHLEGPRLEDLAVKGAAEGADIPILYGDVRVGGQIIVADSLTEHATTEEVGGKGGPSVTNTTYTYTLTYATAFGEPSDGTGLLRRMWSNKNLTEDYTINADALDDGEPCTWYDGSQIAPDPDLVALIGEGNVPAYKGICYAVYVDRLLTDYANRPPAPEAEVVVGGSETDSATQIVLGTGDGSEGGMGYSEATDTFIFQRTSSTSGLAAQVEPYSQQVLKTWDDVDHCIVTGKAGSYGTGEWLVIRADDGPYTSDEYVAIIDLTDNWNETSRTYNFTGVPLAEDEHHILFNVGTVYRYLTKTGGANTITPPSGYRPTYSAARISENYFFCVLENSSTGAIAYAWLSFEGGISWSSVSEPSYSGSRAVDSGMVVVDDDGYAWVLHTDTTGSAYPILAKVSAAFLVEQEVYDLRDWGANGYPGGSGYPGVTLSPATGKLYAHWFGGLWVLDLTNQVADFYSDSIGSSWAWRHDDTGLVWGGVANLVGNFEAHVYKAGVAVPTAIDVSDIISDICIRAGLSASDIDVSSMTATLDGYAHTKQSPAKQDIDALLNLSFSYAVSSDWKLRFLPLGDSTVMTIDADHLGARAYGDSPIEPLQIIDPEYTTIPRVVQFGYMSSDNSLQPGIASSENPISDSNLTITFNYPVTATDADAAEISQKWLMNLNDSISYKFSLPRIYGKLDAGDPILIPTNQGNKRVRITKIDRGVNGVLQFEGISDNDENLVAVTTSSGAGGVEQSILATSKPKFIFMDTPLLRDEDSDTPGPYCTAFTYGDAFPGVVLSQSVDNQNYNDVAVITTEPVVATCETVPSDVDFEDWDDTNTIRVNLITDGTLSSTTEANILNNNANAAAWGRPGRWEIIQFGTATLVSTGVYDLSHLLRGRRGSEDMMDQHTVDDWFIILNSNSTIRHVLSVSGIDVDRYYKATIIGKPISDSKEQEHTVTGVPLKPYSPIDLAATDNTTDPADKDLSWSWRVRYGGTYGGPNSLTDGVGNTLTDEDAGTLRILDSDETTVLNTYSVTGESKTYTDTEQIADYGIIPSRIYFQVAQNNATVGLGYWSKILTYVISSFLSYFDEVEGDTPEMWLRFGETSGTTAADETGNGHTGTYTNTPTLAQTSLISDDIDDYSVLFDDTSSEHVRVNGWKGVLGTGNIAMDILIKCTGDTGSDQVLLQWGDPTTTGGNVHFGLRSADGAIELDINGGSRYGSINLRDSNIHHVMAILGTTAADTEIYVDGERADTTTGGTGTTTRNITSGRDVGIAASNVDTTPTNFFRGTLDEPAIYNVSLTSLHALRHAVAAFGRGYYGDVKRLYPVAYWRLGDISGTTATDEMGIHNGTIVGSPTLNATSLLEADSNPATDFPTAPDGSSSGVVTDYITISDHAEFDFSGDFSIEVLIATSHTTNGQRILQRYDSGAGEGYGLFVHLGKAYFATYGLATNAALSGTTTITDGNTYHIVAVREGTTAKIYVNNVLENSATISSTAFSNTGAINIGSDWEQRYGFDGIIDEVAIYDKALSSDQITDHFVRATNADYLTQITSLTPTAHYRLGEASGTTASDETGSHDATYVGSPTLGQTGLIHGDQNTSVLFDGTDDGAYVALPAAMKVQTITLEAWVKTAVGSGGNSAISLVPSGTYAIGKGAALIVTSTTGVARIRVGDNSGSFTSLDGTTDLRDGHPHHIVGTYDGTTLRIYVDGVEENNSAWGGTIYWADTGGTGPTTGQLYIGAERNNTAGVVPNAAWFTGTIDEAACYASTMSADQVKFNYRKGVL